MRAFLPMQDSEGAKVGMQALPSWLAAAVGTAEVRHCSGRNFVMLFTPVTVL